MPPLDEKRILKALEKVCTEEGLPLEDAHAIWQDVQEIGYDNIVHKVKQEGKKLRERWECVADQPYSIRAAEDWKPASWEDVDVLALKKEQSKLGEMCMVLDVDPHTVERLHWVNLKLHTAEQYNEAFVLNEHIHEKISILKVLNWLNQALETESLRKEVKAG